MYVIVTDSFNRNSFIPNVFLTCCGFFVFFAKKSVNTMSLCFSSLNIFFVAFYYRFSLLVKDLTVNKASPSINTKCSFSILLYRTKTLFAHFSIGH